MSSPPALNARALARSRLITLLAERLVREAQTSTVTEPLLDGTDYTHPRGALRAVQHRPSAPDIDRWPTRCSARARRAWGLACRHRVRRRRSERLCAGGDARRRKGAACRRARAALRGVDRRRPRPIEPRHGRTGSGRQATRISGHPADRHQRRLRHAGQGPQGDAGSARLGQRAVPRRSARQDASRARRSVRARLERRWPQLRLSHRGCGQRGRPAAGNRGNRSGPCPMDIRASSGRAQRQVDRSPAQRARRAQPPRWYVGRQRAVRKRSAGAGPAQQRDVHRPGDLEPAAVGQRPGDRQPAIHRAPEERMAGTRCARAANHRRGPMAARPRPRKARAGARYGAPPRRFAEDALRRPADVPRMRWPDHRDQPRSLRLQRAQGSRKQRLQQRRELPARCGGPPTRGWAARRVAAPRRTRRAARCGTGHRRRAAARGRQRARGRTQAAQAGSRRDRAPSWCGSGRGAQRSSDRSAAGRRGRTLGHWGDVVRAEAAGGAQADRRRDGALPAHGAAVAARLERWRRPPANALDLGRHARAGDAAERSGDRREFRRTWWARRAAAGTGRRRVS